MHPVYISFYKHNENFRVIWIDKWSIKTKCLSTHANKVWIEISEIHEHDIFSNNQPLKLIINVNSWKEKLRLSCR